MWTRNPEIKFALRLPVAVVLLCLLVISAGLLPVGAKRAAQRPSTSATIIDPSKATEPNPQTAVTPRIYQAALPNCKELGQEIVEAKLIHDWLRFKRPNGFVRTCEKTNPQSVGVEQEITMSVEEFQTEEDAQRFLEEIRNWPDTEPLEKRWLPDPSIDVDDFVTWELHGLGQPILRVPKITLFSQYTVAARKEQFVFYVGFIELDSNDAYLGRMPVVMDSILQRWDAEINAVLNSHHAHVPPLENLPQIS